MQVNRTTHILQEAERLILHYGYEKVTMKDISDACKISRTTLYKSYANKEAVVTGLIERSIAAHIADTQKIIREAGSLKTKLEKFFEVWLIEPFASAVGADAGSDILVNVASYAPEAVSRHYQELEHQFEEMLRGSVSKNEDYLKDLPRITALTLKGLKASAGTVEELQRLTDSLVALILMGVEKR